MDVDIDKELIANPIVSFPIADILTCHICQGLVSDPVTCTGCENNFCRRCIQKWKAKGNDSCIFRCKNATIKIMDRGLGLLMDSVMLNCKYGCNVQDI